MKTGEVASRLGVSENTIRNWSREFADHLSEAAQAGDGATRKFSGGDLAILATIHRESQRGLSYDDIRKVLDTGTTIEAAPPPAESNPDRIRESVALTTKEAAEVEILRSQLGALTAQFRQALDDRNTALQEARDARDKVNELYERIAELERSAGRVADLETRNEQLTKERFDWHVKLSSTQEEVERLKRELEKEQNKRRGLFG